MKNFRFSLLTCGPLGNKVITALAISSDSGTIYTGSGSDTVLSCTKVTPTLSVTQSVTFNGLPQSATVTGSVPGTVSNVKLDVAPMVNGVSVGNGIIDMEGASIIRQIVSGAIK